jgi:hypothetical protein
MGKPKNSKVKRERNKNKDGTFTRTGFVRRLVENGWTLKEAVREEKKIAKGEYDE